MAGQSAREAFVWRHWSGRTALSTLLMPLAWLYGLLIALRKGLRVLGFLRQHRLAVPVLVVGNFTVGGTGKTPLTLWLVQVLAAAGFRPGIVSRGYGGTARSPVAVWPDSLAHVCGDEPLLLARESGCPVWVGRKRAEAAEALLAANTQVNLIVLDDGLQHSALARDFEIAVHDERGVGNARLLPAGPLREPVRSVDAIVCNGAVCAQGEYAMRLMPRDLADLASGRVVHLQDLVGLKLHAAAGIGNPGRFFATLRAMGLTFVEHPFPDHHAYVSGDFDFEDCDAVLVTAKDAVKSGVVAAARGVRLIVLRVVADVDPALASLVLDRVSSLVDRSDTDPVDGADGPD